MINPVISKLFNNTLSSNQFGFRPNRDCSLAKAMIAYNGSKLKLNKTLLIDIKKAYDTVDLEELKQIITNRYKDKGGVLLIIIQIYQRLTSNINSKEIYPQ